MEKGICFDSKNPVGDNDNYFPFPYCTNWCAITLEAAKDACKLLTNYAEKHAKPSQCAYGSPDEIGDCNPRKQLCHGLVADDEAQTLMGLHPGPHQ